MGTQQILLIVLSVVIVGIAAAVGIQMFSSQSMNANRQSIAADAQQFAAQAITYFKTPVSMGGAGNTSSAFTSANVAAYLGWASGSFTNANATYVVSGSGNALVITGTGIEANSAGNTNVVTATVSAANILDPSAGESIVMAFSLSS